MKHRASLPLALFCPVLIACSGPGAVSDSVSAQAGATSGDTPGPAPAKAEHSEASADTSASASMGQAIARLRSGDPKGAVAIMTAVTEREPGNGRAWSLLGTSYRYAGDTENALASYRKALDSPDSAPGAMYNMGMIHAAKGSSPEDRDRAFEWLLRARASNQFDTTQIDSSPAAAALRDDPRYAKLFPSAAEFADPFVEPVTVIREWAGEQPGDAFGWIARNIGDVDGDGVADVVTSANGSKLAETKAGKVYVYSSRTGALLWSQTGNKGSELGTGVEAAGDVNGDGVPDVVAGGPGTDEAFVYSGKDGAIVHSLAPPGKGGKFGTKAAGVGDVDGDGRADVAIGAPADSASKGAVFVYSGASGQLLATLRGERAGDKFGSAIAGTVAGGQVLLVLGAPDAGPGQRGRTYVYRGLDQAPAFVIESDENGSELGGMFVSVIGDIDGDKVPDVYASDWAHGAQGPYTGRIYVHSSADGRRLLTLTGEAAGDGFGIGPADAGDVNGDGHDDLIVGAWQHKGAAPSGGKVYLYSGKDGSLMHAYTCKVMGDTFGFDATGMGDVDGDGVIDFLLTSAHSAIKGGRSGRIFIVSGRIPGQR